MSDRAKAKVPSREDLAKLMIEFRRMTRTEVLHSFSFLGFKDALGRTLEEDASFLALIELAGFKNKREDSGSGRTEFLH